jgi:hypothetical protein
MTALFPQKSRVISLQLAQAYWASILSEKEALFLDATLWMSSGGYAEKGDPHLAHPYILA